jgi:PHS family inorganic phosphate transporter-like MFS transporter
MTVYGHIACWRFLLGAGVGGEYPLAATVTSESSSAASRGRLMAAVFAMQVRLIYIYMYMLCNN